MNKNGTEKRKRAIALLTREELEFIDKIGIDALFSADSKLSRVDVISALVDAAMKLEISGEGVKNKRELVRRIFDKIYAESRGYRFSEEEKEKDVLNLPLEFQRRKFPRINEHLHVKFRKMDSLEGYKHASTYDVGMGGFRIDAAFFNEPFTVGQIIEITIDEPDPAKAIGRIAWIKENEDGHSREMGIAFTYLKKKDKERFLKYVSDVK